MPGPPSLEALALDALATHIAAAPSLGGLSEPLAIALFDRVLARGRLTPRVLAAFLATGHTGVRDRAAAVVVDPLSGPPVVPVPARGWLGDAPGWAR